MADLITQQVEKSNSKAHHKKMQHTYLLIISRQDLFDHEEVVAEDDEFIYGKSASLGFDETYSKVPWAQSIYKYFELDKFKSDEEIHEIFMQMANLRYWNKRA